MKNIQIIADPSQPSGRLAELIKSKNIWWKLGLHRGGQSVL